MRGCLFPLVALLAHRSSAIGTPPDLLARASQKRYGPEGLEAEPRTLKGSAEPTRASLALACVKFSFMLNHYVVARELADDEMTLGDPLNGLPRLSRAKFEERWRHQGIVLRRAELPPSVNAFPWALRSVC